MKPNESQAKAARNDVDSIDLLIEGGIAITMVPGQSPINNARVLIKKDRIIEIGPASEIPLPKDRAIQTIDADHAVVMPGLVNAHGHTAMTLFRGFADDLPYHTWLFQKIFPAEAAILSPETVYWGSLLGCVEMIASGTTCLADGYFFQDETVRAVHKAGLRALVAQGVIDFPAPGVPDPKDNVRVGRAFLQKWQRFSNRIRPGLFCHSLSTCSKKTLLQSQEVSKAHDAPIQIHLSETAAEVTETLAKTGLRPTHYLDEMGFVDSRLITVHGVHLDEGELRILLERDAGIIHVPESNMKLAAGVAPLQKIISFGIKAGLGTDGCASNNNLDMFGEMDTAAKLAKTSSGMPNVATAWEMLHMATLGGATALGFQKETGSLEKGKKADIIVVDLNSPHLIPLYDPAAALVYSACGADVRDVIVDGVILMREKRLLSLDPHEIMARVTEISRKIQS